MRPARLASLLVLLAAAGCAQTGARTDSSAASRFASALGNADQAVEAAIERMDGFERTALREEVAIAFAAGGRGVPGLAPLPAGAVEAAGEVLDPGFAALSAYAHALGDVAEGERVEEAPGPGGTELSQAMAQALDRLAAAGVVRVPAAQREAGLAGVAALADLPQSLARRGGQPGLAAVAAEADPSLRAVTALLRTVLGTETGTGTRGVIRTRREALDAQHRRFLEAVQRDSRIGAGERYSIFRSLAELREEDPAQGTLAAIVALLDALEAAHAALAADQSDAAAKVGAFEAAVTELGARTASSRRS
ncbi:hypothetical protein JYK14_04480 [Siccirubricoccus sp. KC 17139]|uniref:Uncharacterized protein n=1 Tax=Siccirubricoccus soli TaxID=2899147 RepID=A0ABT1D0J5_9PROT|nr:hypothetical protein [Siccirubricoccus soli]MCO6415434.1 hypothetical protein [Siccirubricoccus soli]MCP2681566.1 hypothetical protein [Siccirubricoccus soli]